MCQQVDKKGKCMNDICDFGPIVARLVLPDRNKEKYIYSCSYCGRLSEYREVSLDKFLKDLKRRKIPFEIQLE